MKSEISSSIQDMMQNVDKSQKTSLLRFENAISYINLETRGSLPPCRRRTPAADVAVSMSLLKYPHVEVSA